MRLIASSSERGSREAMRQLEGGVSHFVARARAEIVSLLAGVSAAVDFPDEVDEDEAAGDLRARALSLCELLRRACDERSGRIAQEGLNVVIAGRPNVGKSSLINALLREERAIVTDLPYIPLVINSTMTFQNVKDFTGWPTDEDLYAFPPSWGAMASGLVVTNLTPTD